VLAIVLPLAIAGMLLWRTQGAMVWLSGMLSYCL
jgi:hypothetical protein